MGSDFDLFLPLKCSVRVSLVEWRGRMEREGEEFWAFDKGKGEKK